jgi:predicted O-methyltransferase YrrM
MRRVDLSGVRSIGRDIVRDLRVRNKQSEAPISLEVIMEEGSTQTPKYGRDKFLGLRKILDQQQCITPGKPRSGPAPGLLPAVRTIARNALRGSNFTVMAHKVALRLRGEFNPRIAAEARQWCERHATDDRAVLAPLSPALWAEAEVFGEALRARTEPRERQLARDGIELGGGGHYKLLYFLVRYTRPTTAVETGVASGFSSQAILAAMRENGQEGRLYSSDFPYFRLEDPEQYIGWVVEPELRSNWELFVRGDRANLPLILERARNVDLFHYDSDKSYSGRAFAMDAVEPRLSKTAVVVMDDLQHDLFFRDYCARTGRTGLVFQFEGKYVGVLGLPGRE